MKNEVLYLLLDEYADHESVFLAGAISNDAYGLRKNPKYTNKVVAPTMDPVRSCSGFRSLPDYSFKNMPDDYAALVLIGGYGWLQEEAAKVIPIIQKALDRGIIIGAICNAASFMAKGGFVNQIKHTGNGLDQLKLWGGENYTNEKGYVNEQAVRDGQIVTANGSASLEFAKELLFLLKNDTPEAIEMWYEFFKEGFVKMMSK
jgi:putative intracellular protease/amidase